MVGHSLRPIVTSNTDPLPPDSDSESSIEEMTNRGNKLKKRSRFVHDNQLAPPTGPHAYKKVRRSSVGKLLRLWD